MERRGATPSSLFGPRAHSPMLTSAASSVYSSGSYGNTRPLSAPRSSARPWTPGPPGPPGPGRQILDKSYFIGKLRAKKKKLQNEITTMTIEIECLQKRGPTIMQLDHQHNALLQEVKLLRGQLSDYNMVMESVAAGAELEHLKDTLRSLKEKNDNERKKIVELYTQKSQLEQATKIAEETYFSTMVELERRLGREGPDKQIKFREAIEEKATLIAEVEGLESKLEELNSSIEPLEEVLEKTSPANQKKLMLVEQFFNAQVQLQQIQDKVVSLVPLSPKEDRENMLSKIREDSTEISCAKAKSQSVEFEIEVYEERLSAAEKVLSELKGGRAEKFLEMEQKEKKMQSFLDNYEATFHEQMVAKKVVEENIGRLQELTSQVECSNSRRVSEENMDNKSRDTLEKLTQELEIQRGELKHLEQMEASTMNEVEMSKQNIDNLKSDIKKHINLDKVHGEFDSKFLELEAHRKAIEEERSEIQKKLKEQNNSIESLQQQLKEIPFHRNIEILNQKLLALQQNVTRTQEELETKERELNYKPVLENIRFMVGQLNEEIKSKLKS